MTEINPFIKLTIDNDSAEVKKVWISINTIASITQYEKKFIKREKDNGEVVYTQTGLVKGIIYTRVGLINGECWNVVESPTEIFDILNEYIKNK